MIEYILGRGVLSWDRAERQSDRYGTVRLSRHHRPHAPDVTIIETAPVGSSGLLKARVVETRKSTHVGDLHRQIFPSTPELGQIFLLGSGELARGEREPLYVIGLIPYVPRDDDWLDPKALYRLHEQTVDLLFYAFTEPPRTPRTIPVAILGPVVTLCRIERETGKQWPSSSN